MSQLQALTLDSFRILDDGKPFEAFGLHLKRAGSDCMDRPGDSKPRKVTMEVVLIPIPDDDGTCSRVDGQISFKSSVPHHKTKPMSFGLRHGGILTFNPDSPGNVAQTTFMNDEDEA